MELWIVIFVLASGFTAAGLVSAVHETVSGNNSDFRLSFANPLKAGWSLFVCLFAGPYIMIRNTAICWLNGTVPGAIMLFCLGVSVIWSYCSGCFVVHSMIGLGLI